MQPRAAHAELTLPLTLFATIVPPIKNAGGCAVCVGLAGSQAKAAAAVLRAGALELCGGLSRPSCAGGLPWCPCR